MWADTWSLLLLGVVILILLGHETGRVRFHGVLLASLLAWLYFVRPTNAIAIIGVSVYVLIFYKDRFIPFAVTGMLWEVCFAAYSWYHFRQLVPNYYRATRLSFASFGTALVGNLVSPSRGLLIYVPVLLFIIYLLVRYYAYVFSKRLVVLAVAVVVGHLIVISGFSPWHGGGAYGPRYTAPLVPWFVLLGILGLHAMLTWREGRGAKINLMRWRTSIVFGCLMLVISVFINARGAISPETWKWNGVPVSTDEQPDRVWDWRQPQFLAGYLPYPKPRDMPPVSDSRFRCGSQFEKYWWYGWFHEEARCWADSKATIVFSLEQPHELILRIRLSPFLVAGKITAQRLKMTLNDSPLLYLVISDATPQDYGVLLPRELLSERNVIELDMPDAASPQSVGLGSEQRRRSLLVQRIEFDTP
jgi:hypothetical protein